ELRVALDLGSEVEVPEAVDHPALLRHLQVVDQAVVVAVLRIERRTGRHSRVVESPAERPDAAEAGGRVGGIERGVGPSRKKRGADRSEAPVGYVGAASGDEAHDTAGIEARLAAGVAGHRRA